MSDLSKAAIGFRDRFAAWVAANHPGEPAVLALVEEAGGVVAGIEGAAKDAPALVSDAGSLAIDAAKLAADVMAKSLAFADIIGAGRDGAKAWADLQIAVTDFQVARAAAILAAG